MGRQVGQRHTQTDRGSCLKVVVTGASGFVGLHLIRSLARHGIDVTACYHSRPVRADRLVAPRRLDIASPTHCDFAAMVEADVLFHLAWSGLPNYQSPHHTERELPRHLKFLTRCIEAGVRRIVVTGTCLEYGMQEGELHEALPARPVTRYGEAKHFLYQQLRSAAAAASVSLTWCRLFYLFGDGQSPGALYSSLRRAVEANELEFAMSPGDQIRDFIHVDAAVESIRQLGLLKADGVFNVCSGRPQTVNEVVENWLTQWGARISLRRGMLAYPSYEPFEFWGSKARLESVLANYK